MGDPFCPASQLVTRPANAPAADKHQKCEGRDVNLIANFFSVETDKTVSVYDFRVDFDPVVDSPKVRRQLIDRVADRFQNAAGQTAFLYDGFHNLKALTQLDVEHDETVVRVRNQSADSGDEDGLAKQRIIFKRAANPIAWGSFEMMRLYNTIMRQNLKQHLKWMQIMHHFYDPATVIKLEKYGIEQFRGFTTATNQHDGGILMSCDSISKILRADTAHTVMKRIYAQNRDDFRNNCVRELPGCVVITTYGTKQSFRIDDIDFSKTPKSTFKRQGKQITFQQYYKEQYDLEIKDPDQPLLVKLPSAKTVRNLQRRGLTASNIYLIPELCVMTGLTEALRKDMELKRQLTQSTQLPPQQRYEQMMQFRQTLAQSSGVQSELNVWNIRYSDQPVHLQGRVLTNENILVHDKVVPITKPGDFSNDIKAHKMREVKCWSAWAVLYAVRDATLVNEFMGIMEQVTAQVGLSPPYPRMMQLTDDRTATFLSKINELELNPDRMVLCVVPGNNKDRYDAIKKKCYIESPCASQVVLSSTLRNKALRAIARNISLQMACKMGAVPWELKIHAFDAMVIGYDTYRDPVRKESAGGFVCSLNQPLTRYYSRASYHKDWDAMSTNIAGHLREGLSEYQKKNGKLPARVIMFRDGVGDGMIPHVFNVEVKGLQEVIDSFSAPIELAVVIVNKRTNAKFFAKNEQRRVLENPEPGTIVDSVVTRPERLEFYLVSQSVRHGTAAPSSYNVIHNTTKWEPRHMQRLAYQLCHLYFNWQGTIRVPAPCQYAHKLAAMTCNSLHRDPSIALSDRLFFL